MKTVDTDVGGPNTSGKGICIRAIGQPVISN
jgi:hypothetical protein